MPQRIKSHKPPRFKGKHCANGTKWSNQVYTKEWYRLRRWHLKAHPLCAQCKREDRMTLATEVHHKVDISNGGPLLPNEDGLESLCKSCHSKHTYKHSIAIYK